MSRQRRPSIGRGTSPQRHAERGLAGYEWRASARQVDRKSTRLNSSHLVISYAVFCLKKTMGRHEDEAPAVGWLRVVPGMAVAARPPAHVDRILRIVAVQFFFNDTATTEIYSLSLHDALPI